MGMMGMTGVGSTGLMEGAGESSKRGGDEGV